MKSLFALLFITASSCLAMTMYEDSIDCSICNHSYTEMVQGSGTTFGQRLDLKPYGATAAPWIIPRCPKCSFVQYRDSFPDSVLVKLKPFIFSETYKALVKDGASTYYLFANILEYLEYKNSVLAYKYMQASWEVEKDRKKYVAYLEKVIEHLRLGAIDATDTSFNIHYDFLLGEFLRQTEKFDEAEAYYDSLEGVPEFQVFPYNQLIPYEKELIKNKEFKPVKQPEIEKTEEELLASDKYKIIDEIPEIAAFKNSFTIEPVDFLDLRGDGSRRWWSWFYPKKSYKYECMVEFFLDFDSADTYTLGVTPKALEAAFDEILEAPFLDEWCGDSSRIRIRAENDMLYHENFFGEGPAYLKSLLAQAGYDTPDISKWVLVLVDAKTDKRSTESLYHPMGTDLYIFENNLASIEPVKEGFDEVFGDITEWVQRRKFLVVMTSSGEMSLVGKP